MCLGWGLTYEPVLTTYLFLAGKQEVQHTSIHKLEEVTHLEDTHAKGIAQDLVGLIVVAIANVCGCYKELKGVILLYVQRPILYFLL